MVQLTDKRVVRKDATFEKRRLSMPALMHIALRAAVYAGLVVQLQG